MGIGRRALSYVVAGGMLGGLGALVATPPPATAASPNLVIGEVFGGGGNSGAPYRADYIEIFNRGTASASLGGLSLQYASASGTGNFGASSSTLTPLPTATVAPGQRFLVQQSSGSTGAALPAPDFVDSSPMSMSATGAKVVLATGTTGLGCNGSPNACSPTQLGRIVDLVGYGSATFSEGSPAPAGSNTKAVIRNGGGCADTDANAADFAAAAPQPQNSAAPASPCAPPPPTTTVPPPPACGAAATHEIAAVQGTGNSSPLNGQQVRIQGVVVGDLQASGQLGGYYLQDPAPDADPATSDGIFVQSTTAVAVGNVVGVSGRVAETYGLTRLTTTTSTSVCAPVALPPAATVDLPAQPDAGGVPWLERFEGVRIHLPEALTVSEVYNLGRYGEITVSSGGRLYDPTNGNFPGDTAAQNALRRLIVDDASTTQNPATIPFSSPADTPRVGDTLTGATGILSYDFSAYRLQPTTALTLAETNPRPAAPDPVGGNVSVATFNVLNYFTEFGCEDCRGANNSTEFQRQKDKIVAAINTLDADIVGLVELQNNGSTAVNDLVNALNAAAGQTRWAGIVGPAPGTDAIQVALLYQPAAVSPVGPATNDTNPVHNRAPLAQVFRRVGGSRDVAVVVNHFKSKGSCPASGDPNADYGQGCWNLLRTQQAQALLSFTGTLPTSDVLVVGDLNAYNLEDPIGTIAGAGYTHETDRLAAADRYSYVFSGESGELDHLMASPTLTAAVTGADIWHINADEPVFRDYNTEFNPPAYYEPNAYRSSDHDPAVVGLTL